MRGLEEISSSTSADEERLKELLTTLYEEGGECSIGELYKKADPRFNNRIKNALDILRNSEYNIRNVLGSANNNPSKRYQRAYRVLTDEGYIKSYSDKVSLTDAGEKVASRF